DPAIRAATTRIRTILADGPPPAPCPATTPHTDGGPPLTCSLTTPHTLHFDEQRSVRWLPDADTTEGAQ
ncbi:hypothetical protein, partial [Streptomyces sp. sk226]|uniref:hypothetical protein n=1 Tax=Streptomyces sp. sk226 TaxID=2034268 RepID=UPI0015CF37FC